MERCWNTNYRKTNATDRLLIGRFLYVYTIIYRPGSSVGLVTDYELDGPGWNPRGDETLRTSRSVLGSNQPLLKWEPVLF